MGDPKQSIYRFRHADVTTWRAAEQLFRGDVGTVIPLNENFRSTAPILDFVAATAGKLLDTPLDIETGERQPYEIEFARLEPGTPRQADKCASPVSLQILPALRLMSPASAVSERRGSTRHCGSAPAMRSARSRSAVVPQGSSTR